MGRIAAIEVIPVIGPVAAADDLDGTTDTVIVRLTDEAGLTGIGETDAPPHVVKAFLEMPTAHLWSRNAGEILIGADPLEAVALWQRLYDGTFWPGRRGLGIHAISAIDIALYDLAGKQHGVPAYKLLGGARREKLRPYCTIFPGMAQGRPVEALMTEINRQFDAALETGFRAVKMEVLFYDLVTDRELVNLIKRGRKMLGDNILMAVDF
ncbi:MAG TPA: mandelate racemase/muconate lactonizing enzyme family protein, partial [Alphaproteobacteria bacterium]|nr:mandelate racemase/muconate lactonizing enzyme family protein [Alphaproteobacteria bacterium]